MTKAATRRPVKNPNPGRKPKPAPKPTDVLRARRRRDDGNDGPDREPPDPGDGGPAAPTTPDPWFPDVSVHFYGLNWDLENLPPGNFRQQLTAALTAAFPGMASRAAFDSTYSGIDTPVSLSIGLWPGAAQPQYDAARRRGLLALRSNGQRAMSAEALISVPYLRDSIGRAIPSSKTVTVIGGLSLNLTLIGSSVSVVLPSTLHVVASYSGSLPLLGSVDPSVETSVTFGASAGNLTLSSTTLNAGDFGAGQVILQNLFNPLGLTVLILGALGLGGFVIHNLGSNLPALPGLPALPLPNPANLLPRSIPLDVLKMTLLYQTPDIVTRGASAGTPTGSVLNPGPVVGATPGLQVLHLPMAWNIASRVPALAVTGPTSAALESGIATLTYRANTADLVNPSFAWTIGGVSQPGEVSASATLTLNAQTTVVGTSKNFVIGARAVDGVASSLTASNTLTTHGTVIRPNAENQRDPPGGPHGRWGD
jgi:hypothetical protein